MTDYPEGAFKTEQELLDYCKGKEPFKIYIVECNSGTITKRLLTLPWIIHGMNGRYLNDGEGFGRFCMPFT